MHICTVKTPTITTHPSSIVLSAVGKKATLSVTACGNDLKYQWQKNGNDLTNASSSEYAITVTEDDEGEYQCVVSNDAGEVTSKAAHLTICE